MNTFWTARNSKKSVTADVKAGTFIGLHDLYGVDVELIVYHYHLLC